MTTIKRLIPEPPKSATATGFGWYDPFRPTPEVVRIRMVRVTDDPLSYSSATDSDRVNCDRRIWNDGVGEPGPWDEVVWGYAVCDPAAYVVPDSPEYPDIEDF